MTSTSRTALGRVVRLATCNLNQWALDFDGNLRRVMESIRQAKAQNAVYRIGPELELCGYGCEDHFLEIDTVRHCWESLATLLASDVTEHCLCDIGMPIVHKGVRYNCRVVCLDHQVLMIRPKMYLANDGNYRERRYFASYEWSSSDPNPMETFTLPQVVADLPQGQTTTHFGVGILKFLDATVTCEMCEELFVANSPHIALALNGAEIIGNGSGSHHQLRKLNVRVELMLNATAKCGGVYLYSNQQGCDGGRLYYDGCAMILSNGQLVAQGTQFSLSDVEVICATVNLDDVQSYRGGFGSRNDQAARTPSIPHIPIPSRLCSMASVRRSESPAANAGVPLHMSTSPRAPRYHSPEEEIGYGPAAWLWDYLRRSGASGFLLPLSGGADSASTCAIVGIMCSMVVTAIAGGDQQVLQDARRIVGQGSSYTPIHKKELAHQIMHTCFMGTKHSSDATLTRATKLANEIGTYHCDAVMDPIVGSFTGVFETMTGKTPQFVAHGGTMTEDLALQNIQARSRMVYAYQIAQLLPWVRRGKPGGFLLVLGSANVDESLRGYYTKYDCSAADLNPIGGVSKSDLKRFLTWAGNTFAWSALLDVVNAAPTAELRPQNLDGVGGVDASGRKLEHAQNDEEEMGMSYDELGVFGRLRKVEKLGPYSMACKLAAMWGPGSERSLPIAEVASKVKRFFRFYAINRHKMTTLTPSYHAENYSPDDNRYDLRPFLYPVRFERQFRLIDEFVAEMESS